MDITVTERQKKFCDAKEFEVLYGGAAGGGKSYGQIIDAFLYAMKYPGSKQIIFRRTLPELEKSLIRVSLELYPKEVYSYRKACHTGTFVNGSLIDFAYCDREEDVYKYQSAEYDVIRFDELTHFTESMYLYLLSRCRGVNGYPKSVKSSTNPGGIGHSWVKKRFIDCCIPDVPMTAGDMTRLFIPARITDNGFLMKSDPQYLKRLEALSDRDRRALLDGSWDITDGRFFDQFDRSVHVIQPFEAPREWRRYIALDYGLDMLAAYKIALDNSGRAYVLSEVYEGRDNGGQGLIVSQAAARIKELCGSDEIRAVFAPPDLWSRQKDTGRSIADLFSISGVTLTRVSSARKAGWLALKEWLTVSKDESGTLSSRLRIFDCCTNLIRSMSLLQCDRLDPADCANVPHELTHAPDAVRYFISGQPRPAEAPEPQYRYGFSFEKRLSPSDSEKQIRII